jgi:AraC family transcriptional regulator, regulatory protein of adaptative response / methylated-DNA-[protein]-cysteine methyltransferase
MTSRTRIDYSLGPCALGLALVAQQAGGLCAILLGDDADALRAELAARFPKAELQPHDAALAPALAALAALIDTPTLPWTLPLAPQGTDFQQRVWQALRSIPAGQTASYTDVATRLGSPQSVRAVAGACAANPLAVVVPCHRVIGRRGALTGYRWGVERKRALLAREAGE